MGLVATRLGALWAVQWLPPLGVVVGSVVQLVGCTLGRQPEEALAGRPVAFMLGPVLLVDTGVVEVAELVEDTEVVR